MYKLLLALGFISFVNLSAFAVDAPPEVFADKGACPFEGCTYKQWGVNKDSNVFDAPLSHKVIFSLHKGEKIQAITGTVYTLPTRLKVVKDVTDFKKGEVFYLLTNLGEGFWKIWKDGKVVQAELDIDPEDIWKKHNDDNFGHDVSWFRIEKKGRSDWWVNIKTAQGKQGWVLVDEQFNVYDMDSHS